jgi:type II secretory pathway pseudopilin PulG
MKLNFQTRSGLTLVELMVTTVLISALGLIIFSLLNTGTILGAKNTAVNTAHQQARIAMLQMTKNLHTAISPLILYDPSNPNTPAPADGVAAGILFQHWGGGPFRITADANAGQNTVSISVAGSTLPKVHQRLVIPTHDVDSDITAVTNSGAGTVTLRLQNPLSMDITGTATFNIACFTTDVCAYIVNNGALEWHSLTAPPLFVTLTTGITQPKPFQTPNTGGVGSPRVVAAIGLSIADSQTTNRGFKSANILLNGTVPIKAKLTVAATPLPLPIPFP